MKTKGKKLLIIFLVISILLPGLAMPKKANAILGVADVVIDPAHIATSVSGWVQEWGRWLLDQGLSILAATLRKRLIDNITRRTVEMIQGDGEPRFVDNYSGLFEETVNQAVGDTAQQLGLGDLCSSELRLRLRIQLGETTFQDRISCTLDDIVENVEAFDDNFKNGSWLAYNEVLRPANNQLGLRLTVKEELLNAQTQRQEETRQEVEAGGGFLSQVRCIEWQKVADESVSEQQSQSAPVSGEGTYFESPDGQSYTGKTDYPAGSDYYCAESETLTPGSTLQDAISQGISADADFLSNASDDIAGAVATIANAAINQLTRKGVGLLGIGRESEGGTPIGSGSGDCSNFEGAAQDACEEYNDGVDDAQDEAGDSIDNLADQSDEADISSRRSQILTYEKCPAFAADAVPDSDFFSDVRKDIEKDCKARMLASGPVVETGQSHIISADEPHEHSGAYAISVGYPKQILLNYEWSWDQCPGGENQCPELSQASGDLASEDATIPGPAYTPTESGAYILKLTVQDTGGEKTEVMLEEKTMILTAGESHNLEIGESHTHSGAFVSDVAGELQSYDWSLESCPNQCPNVTKSGIFEDGGGGNIEGPTFTPQDDGEYVLQLNIRDQNGSVTSQTVTDTATGESGDNENNSE